MTQSVVRPIGATRTSLVTSSPSEVRSVTVVVYSRGKELSIASFLGPDEKENFARALGDALAEARRGPARAAFNQAEIGWPAQPPTP